jgi:Zn-dependent alcohol dehydrogenase
MGAVVAGASRVVAVDVSPEKLEAATIFGADATVQWAGSADDTAALVQHQSDGGVDAAIEATGIPAVARAAFLSTRARGAAVLIGIPRADAEVSLPALSIPRMERRVLGSIYGSAVPERDFPEIARLYLEGALPIDRLISHRFPLENIAEAFELLRAGATLRSILTIG